MFSSRNSQRGFSLVELMVVVAIIGVLASIAIPSINRYLAKARQSEAKTNLSSLYTSEKAFFAEFNIYSGFFGVVGYTPEGQLRYNVGFPGGGPGIPALNSAGWTQTAVPGGPAGSTFATAAYCPLSGGRCTQLADGTLPNGQLPGQAAMPAAGNTFTAGAAGRIRQGSTNASDQWTINDTKALINVRDGTL
ncbi:type IV pilin protein [Bdellovibrio bacteriovorus]|uniref:type IV pilin protein n=1 Tax=Bdellovibrio bacteriovorus TaxID=959 RepID=UPI0035A687BD